MLKRLLVVVIFAAFVFSSSGCATARKQKDLEIQGLRNQVSALESQVQAKDQEINSLKESLNTASQPKETVAMSEKAEKGKKRRVIPEVKSRPHLKEIQIALKNAGYDPGRIDGRKGKQTTEAIKAFQAANKLKADGRVGKETWALLSEYLYKKIK